MDTSLDPLLPARIQFAANFSLSPDSASLHPGYAPWRCAPLSEENVHG